MIRSTIGKTDGLALDRRARQVPPVRRNAQGGNGSSATAAWSGITPATGTGASQRTLDVDDPPPACSSWASWLRPRPCQPPAPSPRQPASSPPSTASPRCTGRRRFRQRLAPRRPCWTIRLHRRTATVPRAPLPAVRSCGTREKWLRQPVRLKARGNDAAALLPHQGRQRYRAEQRHRARRPE